MTSARPPKAPTCRPPPMTLPKHDRSGVTPKRSCAPPRASRKPVITSSKTSSAPTRSHSARRPGEEPGAGRDQAHVGGDRLDDDARDVARRARAPGCRATTTVSATATGGDAGRARAGPAVGAAPLPPSARSASLVAVVVAGELHDLRPRPVAPAGQPDRRHRRLGAARHQPHLLAGRHPGADLLGQQHLAVGRRAVAWCRRPAARWTASTIAGWAWPAMIAP